MTWRCPDFSNSKENASTLDGHGTNPHYKIKDTMFLVVDGFDVTLNLLRRITVLWRTLDLLVHWRTVPYTEGKKAARKERKERKEKLRNPLRVERP